MLHFEDIKSIMTHHMLLALQPKPLPYTRTKQNVRRKVFEETDLFFCEH